MIKAGVAETDITPPVGVWLDGYGDRDKPSSGILDRLYAASLILESDKTKVAIITVDSIGFDSIFIDDIREKIYKDAGIIKENIMICASHTHSGPKTSHLLKIRGEIDSQYVLDLKNSLIKITCQASLELKEVLIGFGIGEAKFNINRRLMTARGIDMRPNPDGPCDQQVGVISIEDMKNQPLALLVNYACHCTVLSGDYISADYVGYMRDFVKSSYDNQPVVMFTNGASGDVRPNIVNSNGEWSGNKDDAIRLGKILGMEVARVGHLIKSKKEIALCAISKTINLPLEPLLTKDIFISGRNQTLPFEIQMFKLGNIILIGLAGEIFVEIGFQIKKMVYPKDTFVISCANGIVGYIPTAKGVSEGGYESKDSYIYYGHPAPFSPKVEVMILDTIRKMKGNN